jgi:hypothetical protein
MFGKMTRRKVLLLGSILIVSSGLLLGSATVASAWTANKHTYHFKMHQKVQPKTTSAVVAARVRNDGGPWYAPRVQGAATNCFPKKATWTAGITRYVRFFGATVPYCRSCWFHTEFRLKSGPPQFISVAHFSWTGGPWVSLGTKVSSDPVFFQPERDPDCDAMQYGGIRNIQFADSHTRIPNEETTTDNPVVQNLPWDDVRVGPFYFAPPTFEYVPDPPPNVGPPEIGGRTVLARGEIEVEGEWIPFLVQFIQEEEEAEDEDEESD